MKIYEHVPLKDATTLKVGGNARFFAEPTDERELVEAFDFAKKHDLAVFVLGGGSNTFFSDEGFDGLVIKVNISGREFERKDDSMRISAGAGEMWDDLVLDTARRGWWGLENLSLIPGTVGAAPVQNIGAYGVELSDVLEEVFVYDREEGDFLKKQASECKFDYRTSIFKETGRFVITRVVLRLPRESRATVSYRELQDELKERGFSLFELTPQLTRDAVVAIRQRKLPDWRALPTAGSFFKNPIISFEAYQRLRKRFPELRGSELESGEVKVSLAWIIEHICALKGVCHRDACVYGGHALVLVNRGNARAEDIIHLARKISECVKRETGISIEREVQFIGRE